MSSRSSGSAPMPIIYQDMFYKEKGQHPTATQQFYNLAGAIADYIINNIGNLNDRKLSPQKVADFYRIVSGEARWDDFWLRTDPAALSDIFRTIGSFHSLEPTNNPYEPPTIPTLTREGFIRWITLQVLLSPSDNVKNLQYAVKTFPLKHPITGQKFPQNLPAVVFPTEPDPEVTEWHERCGERLKSRYEERMRQQETGKGSSAEPSPRYTHSPREKSHSERHDRGRDPNAQANQQQPAPSNAADATVTGAAAAAASYAHGHARSTSASLPRETRHPKDSHTHSRMRSFDKTTPHPPRDRARSGSYSSDSSDAGPKYSHTYTSSLPKAHATMNMPTGSLRPDRMTPPRDFRDRDREFRKAPSPHSDGAARTAKRRPAMLRHLSANVPVSRAPFSPNSSGSRANYTSDNESHITATSPRSPRSPRYTGAHHTTPRCRNDYLSRVLDDDISPISSVTSTPSGANSPGHPQIRVSVDTFVGSSRQPPFVVSPASPRGRVSYHGSPIDEKDSHYTGKKRSGVIALGESFLNMFSSNSDRSRESSRDRESRLREREWRAGSRDMLDRLDRGLSGGTGRPGRVKARTAPEVEDDISEEEENDDDLLAGGRYGRRDRGRELEEREYERERRGSRRYDEGPPRVAIMRERGGDAGRRSKSHADMDRPRVRPNSVYY